MSDSIFTFHAILSLSIWLAFVTFGVWLWKHYRLTLPLWLSAAVIVFSLLDSVPVNDLNEALDILTEEKNIPSSTATEIFFALFHVSALLTTVGKSLLLLLKEQKDDMGAVVIFFHPSQFQPSWLSLLLVLSDMQIE